MQLQTFNWLYIVQMNLFLRHQITVTIIVDVGLKCKIMGAAMFYSPHLDHFIGSYLQ